MCDIWKDNKNLKQLTEADLSALLSSLRKLGTRQVVMSGGEALLNNNFFGLCGILKKQNIRITLLSTGLTLKKHAQQIIEWVDDVIISLDGTEAVHNMIRNIPDAFGKLAEGISSLKNIDPDYPVTGRTVIHKHNFKTWPRIIETAKTIGLDSISFLPADVSSHAFNREVLWSNERIGDVLIEEKDLPMLDEIVEYIIGEYEQEFSSHFIVESPEKFRQIAGYYKAIYGQNEFPFKKCNAPWVSTVIEADGSVRPCFFHASFGNIHDQEITSILNSENMTRFRRELDINTNETCKKCVCYLNLGPGVNPAKLI
jgi:MoaA/NifB/PqqE/SkfB family radical SAM enzyme